MNVILFKVQPCWDYYFSKQTQQTKQNIMLKYYITIVERTTQGIVLQSVNIDRFSFNESHDSIESAVAEIEKYSEDLKGSALTIIPIININYMGEIT